MDQYEAHSFECRQLPMQDDLKFKNWIISAPHCVSDTKEPCTTYTSPDNIWQCFYSVLMLFLILFCFTMEQYIARMTNCPLWYDLVIVLWQNVIQGILSRLSLVLDYLEVHRFFTVTNVFLALLAIDHFRPIKWKG